MRACYCSTAPLWVSQLSGGSPIRRLPLYHSHIRFDPPGEPLQLSSRRLAYTFTICFAIFSSSFVLIGASVGVLWVIHFGRAVVYLSNLITNFLVLTVPSWVIYYHFWPLAGSLAPSFTQICIRYYLYSH